jgi:Raf kinase inhibitor-like YbhB/YbcL family protein
MNAKSFLALCILGAGMSCAHALQLIVGDGGSTLDAAQVANVFGCNGSNEPPRLRWSGVPEGTQSLAVTMYNMDAPTGSGFWHWIVVGIPRGWRELPGPEMASEVPRALKNDLGQASFLGACPPAGREHRYRVRLYALKVADIQLPPDSSTALVGFNLEAHALQTADAVLTYRR